MPNKIGVVLALDGEQKFSQALKNAQTSAKQFDQELKNLKNEYKDNASSVEALSQKQQALQQRQDAYNRVLLEAKSGQEHARDNYRKTAETLEKYQKQLDEARQKLSEMERAEEQNSASYQKQASAVQALERAYALQANQVQKAEGNLTSWDTKVSKASSNIRVGAKEIQNTSTQLGEAKRSADGAADSLKEVGESAQESGSKTKSLGQSIKEGFGHAIGALGIAALKELGQAAVEAAKYVVKVGSAFEASMSKVEALSGASGADLDALSQKAQELGRSTQFSASEAADAMSNMALAGWNTQQMLDGIDGVLDLAAASGMDLATASDVVAGNLAAFNMTASESGKLADIIATAQAKSKTTADQLAEAYSTSATNMTQYGQSVETTTALLEGMASVNDTGSSAGTKLSAVMAQITQKMEDGAISIGKTKVQVQDADGNFRDLIDIMGDVAKATDGMGDAQKAAALSTTFNRTSLSAVNEILSVGSDQLQAYRSQLEASSGAASDMASTMQDNLKGATTEFQSAVEGLGIAIYDKIKGPLTAVVDLGTDVVNGLTDAIAPAKTEMEGFLSDIQATIDSSADSVSQAQSTIDTAVGQVGDLEHYANVIADLNDKESLNELEKRLLKDAYDGLCSVIPEAAGYYDDETGKIKLQITALQDLIKEKQNQLIEDAKAQAQEKALQGLYDANLAQAQAKAAKEGAQARVDADKKALESAQKTTEEQKQQILDLYAQYQSAEDKMQSAAWVGDSEGLEKYKAEMEEVEDQLSEYGLTLADVQGGAEGLASWEADQLRQYDDNLRQHTKELGEAKKKTDEAADAVKEAQSTVDTVTKTTEEAASSTKAYIDEVDRQDAALHRNSESMDSAASSADKYGVSMGELQAESKASGKSIEELTGSAEKQSKAASGAADSAKKYGNSMGVLQAESKASGKSIKELTDASSESSDEIDRNTEKMISDFHSGSGAAKDAGKEISDTAEETADSVTSATDETVSHVSNATEDLHQFMKERADALKESMEDAYQTSFQNFMDGWDELKKEASQTLSFSITTEFNGGEDQTTETMNENLETQIEGYKKYYENLQVLRGAMQEGIITPEFLSNLEEQGTDAANIIDHMVWTLENQENGVEQVKGISDQYMEAMNWQDMISTTLAGDKAAFTEGLANIGSSDADFSGLRDAVSTGLGDVGTEMSDKLSGLIDTAQTVGATIPEGLTDGISNGDVTAESAVSQLEASIQGALSGLESALSEQGITVGDDVKQSLADALSSGDMDTVIANYQAMVSNLAGNIDTSELDDKGQEASEAFTQGVEGGSDPSSAGEKLVSDTAAAASSASTAEFTTAGQNGATAYAEGLSSAESVSTAASSLVTAAATAATAGTQPFVSAGQQAGLSFATGLSANSGAVDSAGGSLARAAQTGAGSLGNEPFISIGRNAGLGVAAGLNAAVGSVTAAANSIIDQVNRAMQAKAQIHSPSRLMRDQVGVQLTAGVAEGIKKAKKRTNDAAEDLVNSVLAKMSGTIQTGMKSTGDYYYTLSDAIIGQNFGVSRYTKSGSGKKKKTKKKSSADYYGDIMSAASNYYDNMSALYEMDDAQELQYWQNVQKHLKKGTQAWFDAQKKINSAQKSINSSQKEQYGKLSTAGDILDAYSQYYDMSEKATEQYWDNVRKQYKAGTQDRIDADAKYLKAHEDFQKKLSEINEKYDKERQDALDEYTDAINDRREAILGSFDLFDEFKSESDNGGTLLYNIRTQAAGYEDWAQALSELENRGIFSDELMDELTEKGPQESAAIHALLSLTNDELKEYQKAYDTRAELAQRQAEKENAGLKQKIDEKVAEIEQTRATELGKVNTTISTEMSYLSKNILSIADSQTAKLIAAIQNGTLNTRTSIAGNAGTPAGSSAAASAPNVAAAAAQPGKSDPERYKVKEESVVRNKPDKKKGDVVTHLAKGTKIKAIGEKNGYIEFKLNGKNRWIHKSHLKSYARGLLSAAEDELAWTNENRHPEMIVRKADNALLTPLKKGDSVIPSNLTANLWKWGAMDPESLKVRSNTSMNRNLTDGYRTMTRTVEKQNDAIGQIYSLMSEFLPYLAQKTQISIGEREFGDATSRIMAARVRRNRR